MDVIEIRAGLLKAGYDNQGLMWNWFQIWKFYKKIQSKLFLSRIRLFDAIKRTRKILPKKILNKGVKKPRL